VHLYTSKPLGSGELKEMADAGLDEIRFHPPDDGLRDADAMGYKEAVTMAANMGMDAGYEIPVLPDREEDLRAFLGSLVDAPGDPFVNLNELEFSTTNADALRERSYLVRFAATGLRVHYCSASFKDGIQLRRRLGRRAKNVVRPHELVTEDQTLLKGVVECDDPEAIARDMMTRFDVPPDLMVVDRERSVLEMAPWVVVELEPEIDGDCYMVEEYPTWDRLEVERTPVHLYKDL
jgi:pyruvate formate-lyase activating enzyme-like uncharacterized protein